MIYHYILTSSSRRNPKTDERVVLAQPVASNKELKQTNTQKSRIFKHQDRTIKSHAKSCDKSHNKPNQIHENIHSMRTRMHSDTSVCGESACLYHTLCTAAALM